MTRRDIDDKIIELKDELKKLEAERESIILRENNELQKYNGKFFKLRSQYELTYYKIDEVLSHMSTSEYVCFMGCSLYNTHTMSRKVSSLSTGCLFMQTCINETDEFVEITEEEFFEELNKHKKYCEEIK